MDFIPQDLWPAVASFMDGRTKRQMRLASTKWFNIIKYNDFKIYYPTSADIPAITARLSKYSWPIELNFYKAKFQHASELINYLPKLTTLTKVKTDCIRTSRDFSFGGWMQLSILTNIECWEVWPSSVPTHLYTHFPKLTSYRVNFATEEELQIVRQMSQLRELEFHPAMKTWPMSFISNPEILTSLLISLQQQEGAFENWIRFANLKHLTIRERGETSNIFKLHHLTALEKLILRCDKPPDLTKNSNMTKLQLSDCKNCLLDRLESITNLKKLKKLYITNVLPNFNFLLNLPSLRSLRIDDDVTNGAINLHDFTQLTYLESLCVGNFLGGECLDLFSNLTTLAVCDWKDREHLTKLEKLTKLRSLSLNLPQNEGISGEVVNLAGCGDLEILSVKGVLISGLEYLTNLVAVDFDKYDEKHLNFNCFSDLTKLTKLWTYGLSPNESFWSNLTRLENIRELSVAYFDSNERVLDLTSMRHLTFLRVGETLADSEFDGRYLTVLTSLRTLLHYGEDLVSDLARKMPNLISSYWQNDD